MGEGYEQVWGLPTLGQLSQRRQDVLSLIERAVGDLRPEVLRLLPIQQTPEATVHPTLLRHPAGGSGCGPFVTLWLCSDGLQVQVACLAHRR